MSETNKSKNFRLANTYILLTYKTHLVKEEFKSWLVEKTSKFIVDEIYIAHETGESGYDHTHVVVKFINRLCTTSQRYFDYEGLHPNIKPLKGKKAFKDGIQYIAKEDPELAHLLDDEIPPFQKVLPKIWESETIQDVLQLCRMPSDVIPYIQAFKNRAADLRHQQYYDQLRQLELNESQQEWLEKLKQQDDYSILWVVDYKGGIGKSTFCKYMCASSDAIKMQNGKGNDLLYGYNGQEYVLFDFSRTTETVLNYQAIEDIKNGHVFSGKYESQQKFFCPPKIVCFSNFYPDVKKLSYARWDILEYNVPTGVDELFANC